MQDKNKKKEGSFWTTLPGILTGCAAVITATGGLIAALYAAGIILIPPPTPTPPAVTFTAPPAVTFTAPPAATSTAPPAATFTAPPPLTFDAVILLETNQRTYAFTGGEYFRYSPGKQIADVGYPSDLPGGWQGLPADWRSDIDAALYLDDRRASYFFRGNEYIRLTNITMDKGYPRALPGGWQGLPADWRSDIDAALYFHPTGKSYFFRGNEYIRLTDITMDNGFPKDLPGGWENMPTSWNTGIDAAVFRNGHAYFFRGYEYVRLTGTRVDNGYPKPIAGNWPED